MLGRRRRRGGGEEEQQQRIMTDYEIVVYRVYKERWFGLAGLMQMNIVTSWGVRLPLLRSCREIAD